MAHCRQLGLLSLALFGLLPIGPSSVLFAQAPTKQMSYEEQVKEAQRRERVAWTWAGIAFLIPILYIPIKLWLERRERGKALSWASLRFGMRADVERIYARVDFLALAVQ